MLHQTTVIKHPTSKLGMSLLEVILAIALTGALLAAAVSLLVSISTIWSERAERNFFVDHVDGVTEFLTATFATAGVEISTSDTDDSSDSGSSGDDDDDIDPTLPDEIVVEAPTLGNNTSGGNTSNDTTTSNSGGIVTSSEEPITWASPPGFTNSKDPLLNFTLTTAPPLLVGLENAPLLGINTFLYFDDTEGLSLLWYSNLQEETEDIRDLRRTTISTLVTDIQYVYWDEDFEKWETEDEPMEGDGVDQYILPRFIKLTFEYEGETQERTFTIPVPSQSALIY